MSFRILKHPLYPAIMPLTAPRDDTMTLEGVRPMADMGGVISSSRTDLPHVFFSIFTRPGWTSYASTDFGTL